LYNVVQPAFNFYSMNHYQCIFSVLQEHQSDLLVAKLAELGFDGFEEKEDQLLAYIPAHLFDEGDIDEIAKLTGVEYKLGLVEEQNWNAVWESNFQPVFIDGICTVKADFHDNIPATGIEIVINPKMSFGTGHHATTMLMLTAMNHLDFRTKSVLDFGTGTGILAIFAEKRGAKDILAIDCEYWAIQNASENFERNACTKIKIMQATIGDLGEEYFDCILANINKAILIENVGHLFEKLKSTGILLLSGILSTDRDSIITVFTDVGFTLLTVNENANWLCIEFEK